MDHRKVGCHPSYQVHLKLRDEQQQEKLLEELISELMKIFNIVIIGYV